MLENVPSHLIRYSIEHELINTVCLENVTYCRTRCAPSDGGPSTVKDWPCFRVQPLTYFICMTWGILQT